jgi:hypothetical protein
MDFGIKIEEFNNQFILDLQSIGFTYEAIFHKKNKKDIYELRFKKRNIQVDIFFFYEKDRNRCTYCSDNLGNIYELKFRRFSTELYDFNNIIINIPTKVEKFLEEQYGINWKTPIKKWNYLTNNKNIEREAENE